jgi:hypothetical protein
VTGAFVPDVWLRLLPDERSGRLADLPRLADVPLLNVVGPARTDIDHLFVDTPWQQRMRLP